jgi:hypothetical protein
MSSHFSVFLSTPDQSMECRLHSTHMLLKISFAAAVILIDSIIVIRDNRSFFVRSRRVAQKAHKKA